MKKLFFILTLLTSITYSQEVKFDKSTLKIKEPFEKDREKSEEYTIELNADKIPSSGVDVELELVQANLLILREK